MAHRGRTAKQLVAYTDGPILDACRSAIGSIAPRGMSCQTEYDPRAACARVKLSNLPDGVTIPATKLICVHPDGQDVILETRGHQRSAFLRLRDHACAHLRG